MPKIPSFRAMVFCAQIQEGESGRPSLLGVLNYAVPPRFPHRQALGVYVCIGEVGEGAKVQLKVSRARADTMDGDPVGESHELDLIPGGPIDELGIAFPLREVEFSVPGVYVFALYVNGRYLAERKLPVLREELR